MKKFTALLFIASAILSITSVSQAAEVYTAIGRAGIPGFHSWDEIPTADQQDLKIIAISQVNKEMKTTCLNVNKEPVVLDVVPVGSRYNHFADAVVFKLQITYACLAAAQ